MLATYIILTNYKVVCLIVHLEDHSINVSDKKNLITNAWRDQEPQPED